MSGIISLRQIISDRCIQDSCYNLFEYFVLPSCESVLR